MIQVSAFMPYCFDYYSFVNFSVVLGLTTVGMLVGASPVGWPLAQLAAKPCLVRWLLAH